MNEQKPKGPAQPAQIDQAQNQTAQPNSGSSSKSGAKDAHKQQSEDMPGAEGPLSARADQDTYD